MPSTNMHTTLKQYPEFNIPQTIRRMTSDIEVEMVLMLELVVTMVAISHRQQQQDGRIRPLRRWKKGFASAAALENSRKNMA
jgi:hypothetical protein